MLLVRLGPSRIRIEGRHRFRNLRRVGTKILFVNGPCLIDNESHHTRGAVLRRIGDKGKSRGHLPVDDIILGSARCMRPLAREDPEKIALERDVSSNLALWEILAGVSAQR